MEKNNNLKTCKTIELLTELFSRMTKSEISIRYSIGNDKITTLVIMKGKDDNDALFVYLDDKTFSAKIANVDEATKELEKTKENK